MHFNQLPIKEEVQTSQTAHRNYLNIRFFAHYALRGSDLAALTWQYISQERGTMGIIQKGNHVHEIPILDEDWRLLNDYQRTFDLAVDGFICKAVRQRQEVKQQKPISTSYIYKMVKRVAETVIPGKRITPHSFRTTFVSEALACQIGTHEIGNATGHHDIHMVRYYDRPTRPNPKQCHHSAQFAIDLKTRALLAWTLVFKHRGHDNEHYRD